MNVMIDAILVDSEKRNRRFVSFVAWWGPTSTSRRWRVCVQ